MSTSTRDYQLQAGVPLDLQLPGNWFQIGVASAAMTVVKFGGQSGVDATHDGVSSGFSIQEEFDRLRITSATTQTVKLTIGYGQAGTSNPAGQVQVLNAMPITCPSFGSVLVTVGTAVVNLLTPNNARKAIIIQNHSATDALWFSFGVWPAVNGGIRLGPGATWESGGFVPTGFVVGIAAVAGVSVSVLEGS